MRTTSLRETQGLAQGHRGAALLQPGVRTGSWGGSLAPGASKPRCPAGQLLHMRCQPPTRLEHPGPGPACGLNEGVGGGLGAGGSRTPIAPNVVFVIVNSHLFIPRVTG